MLGAGRDNRHVSDSSSSRLWITAPGHAELREEAVPVPGEGQVLISTCYSGISRGTERLVFEGRVPKSERERMRAPHQSGDFPFPVNYGYSLVGRVIEGPGALAGRTCFALAPHGRHALVPADDVVPLPDNVPARRAVLAANVETALNALWDGGAGPGDRIAVIGAGVIGGAIAAIAARFPGAEVELVDIDPARAGLAKALSCRFAAPDDARREADIVFHTSADETGLATALALAGDEAKVVEVSWYGDKNVSAPLGAAFHSRRLALVSSQVGTVSASRRSRWTHRRRLAVALGLLADPRFDALLGEEIGYRDLPDALPRIFSASGGAGCPVVRYD